ncbi:MAG: AMP-binding protein [Deltaproteobacteria bacterium]|nr:AMP-binding protein [Deltaproteobacteria bacterium]
MKTYFDDRETISVEERKINYNERLSQMVQAGYEKSVRVRETLDALGFTPSDIATCDDLQKLPVISREALVEWELKEPPFGGFSEKEIAPERIFISPGPVYEPHLMENSLWGRGYHAAGFRKGDIVINAFSYHMVAAGLTFHEGLRSAGATVVPSGTSGTETQVALIRDLSVTGYTGTPSFLKAIIEKAEGMGYSFGNDFSLRRAVFVAEPLQPSLREVFEKNYGIDTYQMYGATEVGDIAYECTEKKGWHICEEVIVEIVDPSTGTTVEEGTLGEVVVTRLNDMFFLFRFGTGDLSRIIQEPCSCGRTAVKLDGIAGRVGDAVKIRGLFVTPSQLNAIRNVLEDIHFQLVITRESYRDYLTVKIAAEKDEEKIRNRFGTLFHEICTVKIDTIEFVDKGGLSKEDKLIVDKRDWK